MDLKLFFDPVEESILDSALSPSAFQNIIYLHTVKKINLRGIRVALIGLSEGRGHLIDHDIAQVPNRIRKCLYQLTMRLEHDGILDLGDLRDGPSFEETNLRLKEVCEYLLSQEILPVIFGGLQNFTVGQYLSYESTGKLITLLNIDAKLDLEESENPIDSYLGNIFKYNPNYLFNYIHLGYQSYLLKESKLNMIETLGFDAYRLGEFRDDIKEVEPIIREADLISFDLSAIQSTYCPDTTNPNVFGYSGEEACQLCWYAGLNSKLCSIGFYNITAKLDEDIKTAQVVATMIWYFIDGVFNRIGDQYFKSSDYLIYEVSLNGDVNNIRFFKSKLSEKWWMEIEETYQKSVFLRNKMIPCSYNDYKTALSGELPERWIKARSK